MEEKVEERLNNGLQKHFETIMDELGNSRDWTLEKANEFYERFFDENVMDKQLILRIYEIKEYPNFNLFIAYVLNPISFNPFLNPFLRKEWSVAFTLPKERAVFKENQVVLANAEKLNMSHISTENRKLDLVAIDVNSIQIADVEATLKGLFGNSIIQKLILKFGSLESIAPFILNQLDSIIEEEINNTAQYLEKQEIKLENEHNKIIDEKVTRFKEIEIKLEQEHQVMLEKYEKEKEELEQLKRKNANIQKMLDDKEEKLKRKESDLQTLEENLEDKAKAIKKYENLLETQFQRFQLLNPIDKEGEDEGALTDQPLIKWSEQDDIISIIRGALHAQCDLQYSRNVIEQFVGALKTDQLIILHGPSGTGKSSLVGNFSQIIKGAKTCTIRVQSSWTDKQDLLGFFNPLDYQYISTPFLDTLVEANRNKENLYILCLDEMNLAHVEYYFAEFLSAREERERKINLYSSHFQRLAMNIIKPYLIENELMLNLLKEEELLKLSTAERIKIQNCFDLCYKYPAEFNIPNNVRFVGTMNLDHTVKGLSPKIIDRSFVIKLEYPEDEESLFSELEELKVRELITLDINSDITVSEMNDKIRQEIRKLNPLLDVLGARLNRRALDQIGWYSAAIHTDSVFDQIVLGKILPRIDILKDDEKIQAYNELISKLPISEDTRRFMKDMVKDGRTITYWR